MQHATIHNHEYLDALVCGLPSWKRATRLFGMLTGFIDDSGSDGTGNKGQGPVFILAGYVSSVDRWNHFSDEWAAALVSGPRPLRYFKMREANSLKDQFDGWTEPERDAKLKELARIVKNNAMFGVNAVLWWKEYQAIQAQYQKYQVDPYILLFNYVMSSSVTHIMGLNIEDKIKFIFDEQGDAGDRAIESFRQAQHRIPPVMLQYLAGPPTQESEMDFPPLQSADMIAWQMRRFCYENEVHGMQPAKYKFHPTMKFLDEIPTETRNLTGPMIRKYFQDHQKMFPR